MTETLMLLKGTAISCAPFPHFLPYLRCVKLGQEVCQFLFLNCIAGSPDDFKDPLYSSVKCIFNLVGTDASRNPTRSLNEPVICSPNEPWAAVNLAPSPTAQCHADHIIFIVLDLISAEQKQLVFHRHFQSGRRRPSWSSLVIFDPHVQKLCLNCFLH